MKFLQGIKVSGYIVGFLMLYFSYAHFPLDDHKITGSYIFLTKEPIDDHPEYCAVDSYGSQLVEVYSRELKHYKISEEEGHTNLLLANKGLFPSGHTISAPLFVDRDHVALWMTKREADDERKITFFKTHLIDQDQENLYETNKGWWVTFAKSNNPYLQGLGDVDGTIKIINVADKQERDIKAHNHTITNLALSHHNALWVSTAQSEGVLKIWDNHTGQLIQTFPHENILVVQWHSDNQRLFSMNYADSNSESEVRIWDVRVPRLIKTFKGEDLDSLTLLPQERFVVGGIADHKSFYRNLDLRNDTSQEIASCSLPSLSALQKVKSTYTSHKNLLFTQVSYSISPSQEITQIKGLLTL
jgi:WD40 repeat protein